MEQFIPLTAVSSKSTAQISHEANQASMIRIGSPGHPAWNSAEFWTLACGQAAFVRRIRLRDLGFVRLSDNVDNHKCSSDSCTLENLIFTVIPMKGNQWAHVCVDMQDWMCPCYTEMRPAMRLKQAVTFRDLFVCTTSDCVHICTPELCQATQISVDDGWVCELTGRQTSAHNHDACAYHLPKCSNFAEREFVPLSTNAHLESKPTKNRLRPTCKSDTGSFERKFISIFHEQRTRFKAVAPLMFLPPGELSKPTASSKRGTVFTVHGLLRQAQRRFATKAFQETTSPCTTWCVAGACNWLSQQQDRKLLCLDQQVVISLQRLHIDKVVEWYMRLCAISERSNMIHLRMYQENFMVAALHAQKRGVVIKQYTIIPQDLFLQHALLDPSTVTNKRGKRAPRWYSKHGFSQVSKQLFRWLHQLLRVGVPPEACKICDCDLNGLINKSDQEVETLMQDTYAHGMSFVRNVNPCTEQA